MKKKFLISGIMIMSASFLTCKAFTDENSSSIAILISATALFLTGVTIFIMNFRK